MCWDVSSNELISKIRNFPVWILPHFHLVNDNRDNLDVVTSIVIVLYFLFTLEIGKFKQRLWGCLKYETSERPRLSLEGRTRRQMGTNSQFNIKTTHSCLSLRQRRLQPVHHSPRRVPLLLQGSLLRVMITFEYCHSGEAPFDSLVYLC